VRPVTQIRRITADSVEYGLKVPVVRYLMLAGVFTGGVGIYVFYALQPYLLELYGNPQAYGIAGLVAAIVAGAQIVGGFSSASVRRLFARRTSALLAAEALATAAILVIGLIGQFWVVIVMIVVWAVVDSAARPIRQAFLNALIPSRQRATILSFDSMMASSGGVVAQPLLGRAADVWGYPASYVISGGLSAVAIPLVALAQRQDAGVDRAEGD
jgi:MFS family permease